MPVPLHRYLQPQHPCLPARQAAASSSAGTVVAWLSARLEAMRALRLWSPCHPLESFATCVAQLLGREGLPRLQAFSYAGADASISRLLAELPSLTSLQVSEGAAHQCAYKPPAAVGRAPAVRCTVENHLPSLHAPPGLLTPKPLVPLAARSSQLLDILSPFALAGQGQGLVVRAKELAR